ncbi:Aspartate aminotransferase, cytoplasmic [Geranomyces variabilis]|uniref:aspartate transaminase n=1 Tax=Geranomyces variabilis TaxID=109894 RepID=A0AAD5TTI1_9FUNG|nr:Aspartate aminotransferase, cytoplasmic [Geranomyces variabilis]
MTITERIHQLAVQLTHANASEQSVFHNVPLAPPDAILNLNTLSKADPYPTKINVGVGAYRDEDGKPWVLPVVKKAESVIVNDASLDHEYLPIDGLRKFTDASAKLILGKTSPAIVENRFAGIQTISGSGAVRLGADFLNRFRKATVYVSNPTWGNHHDIFRDAGLPVQTYPYWDPDVRGLAFQAMIDEIQEAPKGSIFVLHPCAHNPTGVDPTADQWRQIADAIRHGEHFPFFDCAYQGFASGDLDRDAAAVRYFVEQGFELLVAQSYSKNMGLYGERTGCLTVVTKTPELALNVRSQMCKLSRASISNPPAFGARIVSMVLNDEQLFTEWKGQLKVMADRIIHMREVLFETLTELKTPGTWNHIVDQIGMFTFTGLNAAQVKVLRDKHHIYMTDNGRISMAGLNSGNIRIFAEAVDDVVRHV